MLQLAEVLKDLCWALNVAGIVVIIATRASWHTKAGWAASGLLLLLIAVGNAVVFATAGLNPGQQASTLFGLIVLGSLGSRFVGNWLTDGAA